MGTRNLTMVISNGQTKVAQYGQWDGYPSGQGATVLDFLHKADLQKFKQKVDDLSFYSDKELKNLQKEMKGISDKEFETQWPEFDRDWAAEILNGIYNGELTKEKMDYDTFNTSTVVIKFDKNKLKDSSDFANDSLFCEWAYVIDLDKNTFEVYKGFNKNPLQPTERFYNDGKKDGEYYPVKLAKEYSLSTLPTSQEFISDFRNEDEEED